MVNTAEQQKRSANKKRYKILKPLDAITNTIIESNIIKQFESLKQFPLKLIILLPSTIIRLEIALIRVSMLLMVNDIPRTITITDSKDFCSLNNKEKKARSGITLESIEAATNPVKPIKKTTGIIKKNEISKLFFNIILFFAA